ncbi:MAG: response regulator [Treponema sp.]|jgi:class 3 adenylate cyclase|nr:response regulator [Treponema sp.]
METKYNKIILVDDNPSNLRVGKNVLSKAYEVYTVPSAAKLFELLSDVKPAMILLDIEMPAMNGYEAIKILKAGEKTRNIPVIFLTGKTDTENELEGLDLGAVDYITKPFQPALLLKRIEVHLLVEAQKKVLEDQQRKLEIFNTNLKDAFSRYLSPAVVNEIIQDPSKLNLGGEKREMTALFTDIQNFTTISEQLEPVQLVRLLNHYLSDLSNIITENLGTIDKYVGDAIVAFFGAPLHQENHAALACRSALQIKEAEKTLNRKIVEEQLSPLPLFTRIGINTGSMIVGNMGSENKLNYTVMGSAVNLASRLEGVNKLYRTGGILISEYTLRGLGDEFVCRSLDRVRVVGSNSPVRIYELTGFRDTASPAAIEKTAVWEEAMEHFENRRYEKAEKIFSSLARSDADDTTVKFYIGRCRDFIAAPPPGDWDGVNNLTRK